MISFLLTRNLTLRLHELLSDLIEIFYSVSALKKKKCMEWIICVNQGMGVLSYVQEDLLIMKSYGILAQK